MFNCAKPSAMNRSEYSDEIFVHMAPDDDPLRCCICQNIMKDAVMCQNQHCFCEGCLTRALANKRECPTCSVHIHTPQPARMVRGIVNRLEVYCTNRCEGCKITAHLDRIHAHEEHCEYSYTSCTFPDCQKKLQRRELAAHVLQCRYASFTCPACGEVVMQAESSKHACFSSAISSVSSLKDQIEAMKQEFLVEIAGLKKELQTEKMCRKALEDRLSVMEGSAPLTGKPKSVAATDPLASRPTTGYVVTLSGTSARGCITQGEVGWVAKDEHDHQPFHVWNWKKKAYWYRESEIRSVARPHDIVTASNAHAGMPCVRGPDWRWGTQDQGSFGFISDVQSTGWCNVTWESGRTGRYRIGAQDAYDLIVANMNQYTFGPVSSM